MGCLVITQSMESILNTYFGPDSGILDLVVTT
jgi:hypothetical protein